MGNINGKPVSHPARFDGDGMKTESEIDAKTAAVTDVGDWGAHWDVVFHQARAGRLPDKAVKNRLIHLRKLLVEHLDDDGPERYVNQSLEALIAQVEPLLWILGDAAADSIHGSSLSEIRTVLGSLSF